MTVLYAEQSPFKELIHRYSAISLPRPVDVHKPIIKAQHVHTFCEPLHFTEIVT